MNDIMKMAEASYIVLDEFGVKVNTYLTYDQIQAIVNAVKQFDSWAERQQAIDMMVMYYATDIVQEKLEEIGHDVLLKSGLIDKVKGKIENFYLVDRAIGYTESTQRALAQIIKQLPEIVAPLKKEMANIRGGKK